MIANFHRTKYATGVQYLLIMLSKRKAEREGRRETERKQGRTTKEGKEGGNMEERGVIGTLDLSPFFQLSLSIQPVPTSMGPRLQPNPLGSGGVLGLHGLELAAPWLSS